MVSREAEYTSLREELIAHQSRRETVLSIGLTAVVALIVIGIEQSNPYTLLLVFFILFSVHMHIIDIHAGIQRIATYLRIVYEGEGSQLRWETASHLIRHAEMGRQRAQKWRRLIFITPVFSSMEYLLGFIGLTSLIIAVSIARTQPDPALAISLLSGGIGLTIWGVYWKKSNARMKALEGEEEEQFRKILGLKKKEVKILSEEEKPKVE